MPYIDGNWIRPNWTDTFLWPMDTGICNQCGVRVEAAWFVKHEDWHNGQA